MEHLIFVVGCFWALGFLITAYLLCWPIHRHCWISFLWLLVALFMWPAVLVVYVMITIDAHFSVD